MRARLPIALATCVFLVLANAPARAQPAAADWRVAIEGLLADRATAVVKNDRAGFLATMTRAPKAFRDAKLAWFGRMQQLDIETYSLELSDDSYEDLAAALAKRPRADEVHVVEVKERIGIAGYDEQPSAEELFLTVVRDGTAWSIVSDSDLADLGLLSERSLWDFAPVRQLARSGVLVLYHDDRAAAERILSSTIDSVAYVQRRWPLEWRARTVVLIPRTTAELGRILRTPIDLGPFVAFTSSSVLRERAGFALTGHRISVQPGTFFATSISFRNDTMSHEVLHLATREIAGAWTPSWLDEGVAQVYGERATQPNADLVQALRSGVLDGLPQDYRFFTGGRDQIRAAYEAAASFITFLRARFGSDAGARLYRAVGGESAVSLGTGGYHADHATRRVFRRTLRDLERAWVASLV